MRNVAHKDFSYVLSFVSVISTGVIISPNNSRMALSYFSSVDVIFHHDFKESNTADEFSDFLSSIGDSQNFLNCKNFFFANQFFI